MSMLPHLTISSELKWYDTESRFGWMMEFDPSDHGQWGEVYVNAVRAAKGARFEFDENQNPERLGSIARRVVKMLGKQNGGQSVD